MASYWEGEEIMITKLVMWRPENWISEISFEEISKISPRLVSMMTIKEKKLYEAGADAMLKALSELSMVKIMEIMDKLRIS